MPLTKWQQRYLNLAQHVATWSRDPSTQVGAVIVRPDKTIASVGFNGLPRGVDDSAERLNDRDTKLSMTLHAEQNAVLAAHERLDGCTVYVWPMPPCSHCAAVLIQAGIVSVIAPSPSRRWIESCLLGREMLREAGVATQWVNSPIL